jgi:hypothetical protein
MEPKRKIKMLFKLKIGGILEEINWLFQAILIIYKKVTKKNKNRKLTTQICLI